MIVMQGLLFEIKVIVNPVTSGQTGQLTAHIWDDWSYDSCTKFETWHSLNSYWDPNVTMVTLIYAAWNIMKIHITTSSSPKKYSIPTFFSHSPKVIPFLVFRTGGSVKLDKNQRLYILLNPHIGRLQYNSVHELHWSRPIWGV